MSRIMLVHWEPEAYEHLPQDHDSQLVCELVAPALIYRDVLVKDTDLILNDRVIRTFLESGNLDVLREFLRLGLVKITMRPVRTPKDTSVDPVRCPLMFRALNIRTFKNRRWGPTDEGRRFYRAVDDCLAENPCGVRPVNAFPLDRNPFAQWLGDLLEEWEQVIPASEFCGIPADTAAAHRLV